MHRINVFTLKLKYVKLDIVSYTRVRYGITLPPAKLSLKKKEKKKKKNNRYISAAQRMLFGSSSTKDKPTKFLERNIPELFILSHFIGQY